MCSGIPIKLLNFSDLTKFLVLNFHAKHHIFNGLDTWLLGAVNKLSKNNRSIDGTDAFDTLYIGCEKFPYRDSFSLSASGII